MAICDDVPGLTVKVKVAGVDATEYDDNDGPQEDSNEENALNRVFRFIESKDNASFSIHCSIDDSITFETPNHRLACYVHVDGKSIHSQLLCQTHYDYTCKGIVSQQGSHGAWKLWPLQFAGITTVDTMEAERVKKDSKTAKSVGLIRVLVHRCICTGPSMLGHQRQDIVDGPRELAEKALKGKAVSHGLSFKNSVSSPAQTFVTTTKLDNGRPLVVFEFKYRSRDSLQKLMVIPRTPTPDAVEEEIGNLSQEAIVSLARRQLLNDRASSNDTIKAENRTVIKKEAEVYDLTGDAPVCIGKRKRAKTIDLTDD